MKLLLVPTIILPNGKNFTGVHACQFCRASSNNLHVAFLIRRGVGQKIGTMNLKDLRHESKKMRDNEKN